MAFGVASVCAAAAVPLGSGGPRAVVGTFGSILAGSCLLGWVAACSSVLRSAGVPTRSGASWAVASFFVPFVNLWMPPRTVADLAGRRDPWGLAWAWWLTTLLDRAVHLAPRFVDVPEEVVRSGPALTAIHFVFAGTILWVAGGSFEARVGLRP